MRKQHKGDGVEANRNGAPYYSFWARGCLRGGNMGERQNSTAIEMLLHGSEQRRMTADFAAEEYLARD